MKKLTIVFLGVFLLTSNLAFARHQSDHCSHCFKAKSEKMIAKKMKKYTKKLQLTPDQQSKIEKIMQDKWAKKDQIYQEKQDKMTALNKEYRNKVNMVLNSEQKAKFQEMNSKYDKKNKKCGCKK